MPVRARQRQAGSPRRVWSGNASGAERTGANLGQKPSAFAFARFRAPAPSLLPAVGRAGAVVVHHRDTSWQQDAYLQADVAARAHRTVRSYACSGTIAGIPRSPGERRPVLGWSCRISIFVRALCEALPRRTRARMPAKAREGRP